MVAWAVLGMIGLDDLGEFFQPERVCDHKGFVGGGNGRAIPSVSRLLILFCKM